jgi:hypothetical protein
MKVIEIKGIKDIRDKIHQTEMGRNDYEDSVYLLLRTKKKLHYFLKKEIDNPDGALVRHASFSIELLGNLTGRYIHTVLQKSSMELVYWEIYDEIIEDMNIKN